MCDLWLFIPFPVNTPLSDVISNPPHVRWKVVADPTRARTGANLCEWEGGQIHPLEWINYELSRFLWFSGWVRADWRKIAYELLEWSVDTCAVHACVYVCVCYARRHFNVIVRLAKLACLFCSTRRLIYRDTIWVKGLSRSRCLSGFLTYSFPVSCPISVSPLLSLSR